MSSKVQNRGVTSFGHFLEYLRLNKFRVGVAHYARVQQVLDRVIEDFHPDDPEYFVALKSLLRPLFASTEEEQHKFTKLYDDYIQYCQRDIGAERGGPNVSGKGATKDALVKRDATGTGKQVANEESWTRSPLKALKNWWQRASSKLTPARIAIIILVGAALVALIYLFIKLPGLYDRFSFPSLSPNLVRITARPTPEVIPIEQPTVDTTASPPPVTPSPTATPLVTPPQTQREPPPVFYLAVALLLLLLLLLYALIRRGLRSLDPDNYRNKKPPFKWPLRVVAPANRLYDTEELRRAARLLRRRQVDEFFRLDLSATISATIGSLGYPVFRYRLATRVPEYLVLIERVSPRDHQALLFEEMVKALRRDGVIVTRYFYGDDPLVCCDVNGENCVSLERLKQRHEGHRLLLFGSGEKLLDPVTGRLTEGASVFYNWHERAVLTPETDWGWRERVLSNKFIVVPADTHGLITLVNQIESPEAMSSGGWPLPDARPLPPEAEFSRQPDDEGSQSLESVRDYLGPQLFQWLCTCAVYTELRWELTLLLGSLPLMPKGAINEQSLLRLSRLPWFRKGSIPDAVRARLIESLDPVLGYQTREVLVRLMEKSMPPPGTYASDAHGLELALQRWLLRKDKKSVGELREAIRKVPSREISRSEVLSRFLRRVPHKIFGHRLPGIFYRRGLPALGLSKLSHAALSLALIAAALVTIRARSGDVPAWAYSIFASPTPTPTLTPTPNESPTPPVNMNTIVPPTGNSDNSSTDNGNAGGNVNSGVNNQNAGPIRNPRPNSNRRPNVNNRNNVDPGNVNRDGNNSNGSPGGEINPNGNDNRSGGNLNQNGNSNGKPDGGGEIKPQRPPGIEIYRGTIDDDNNVDDEVSNNIEPVLQKNPGSVVYLISGDKEVAQRIEGMIQKQLGSSSIKTTVLNTGDTTKPQVNVVIKSESDPPPNVPGATQPKMLLPKSAVRVGGLDYPQNSDDAENRAGNISILNDILLKSPGARGYIVANRLSNGRLGENRFDIYSISNISTAPKDRVSVILDGTDSDHDVSIYVAYDGALPVPPPIKFDEYGDIGWGDTQSRLDNMALQLQQEPGSTGYIICYGVRGVSASVRRARCKRQLDDLVNRKGLDLSRIVTLDGGYRDSVSTELWVVPANGIPPVATPTVTPGAAQTPTPTPTPTRTPRRRGVR